jgi:preprotein translocase subunit SecE
MLFSIYIHTYIHINIYILIDWLIGWLVDWLIHSFIHSLIHWFIDSLIHWLICVFVWRYTPFIDVPYSNLVDSCSFPGGRICWVNLGWVGLVGCMLLEGAMYQQTRKNMDILLGVMFVPCVSVLNLFMLRSPMFAWFWLRAGSIPNELAID